MKRLPPLPRWALRAALEAAGAPPRRRHGQHFLVDDNLLAALVREAEVGPEDVVLEVGPGPGLLTRHLLATGARVRAVEIDARVEGAARRLVEAELQPRLHWTSADALDGPQRLSRPLLDLLPGSTRVVSNLPYNVAAPLIALLLAEGSAPDHLMVMVQAEMAQRLLAGPGSRNYGGLSVSCALLAEGRVTRRVPPEAFWPVPKVASAIISLHRRPDRPAADEMRALHDFLARAFHARRKTLCNSVGERSGLPAGQVAQLLELDEIFQKLRAEAFSPLQFRALARTWAAHAPGERHRP